MFLIQGYDRLLQATYFYLPKFLYVRPWLRCIRGGSASRRPPWSVSARRLRVVTYLTNAVANGSIDEACVLDQQRQQLVSKCAECQGDVARVIEAP